MKKICLILAVILILCALYAGCGGDGNNVVIPQTPVNTTVSGLIYGSDLLPVVGPLLCRSVWSR